MDVRIDTLRLQVAGVDPSAAGEFARQVAELLGPALAAFPAPAVAPRLGRLRVTVHEPPGATPYRLAASVAAEVAGAVRSANARARGQEAPS